MLSEHIFFVIERITDILKLEEAKKVSFSNDVKKGIIELQKELLRIYDYLRDVEQKYDDKQVLSDHEQQFYLHLSSIADYSDDILTRVMSKDDDDVTYDKCSLFAKTGNSQPVQFRIEGNNNMGSNQRVGNIVDHVTSKHGDNVADDIDSLLAKIRNSYNPYSTRSHFIVANNINESGIQTLGNFEIISSLKGKRGSRPKSFGHYPNPDLVGFSHEIKTLLNHLVQLNDETSFVGIVGMGGSGKTTLAKHIYHHPKIKTQFTCKAWICISLSWDKTSILNHIWRQVTQDHAVTDKGYDLIAGSLYTFLSSQTYLIILDDIWSIDAWYNIYQAFPNKRGSNVVITTRNKFLPKYINANVLVVEPNRLNEEESYELFMRRASLTNESISQDLVQLGMKMVDKCLGLPLAIVALADFLKMDKSPSNWQRISKKLTHNILKMGNEPTQEVVKDILTLSYYELPFHLKACVLYLHVFPEDYEIEAQKLIQMWIAECFVDDEFVAKEYLEEMAQRCIVQVVKTDYKGQVRLFRIHHLIRQMLVDMNKDRGLLKDTLRLVPRETLYGDEQKSYDSHMEVLLRYSSHVRSLILLGLEDRYNLELQPLFIKLRLLRVLILNQIPVKELPEEIGIMIHLRYLELSGNSYHLPESIGNLENLLTIDIRNLDTSSFLINLEKLKELRHVYMPIETKMEVLKLEKLEKLKKLKTLWGAKGGTWMLLGMPNLSATLEELCVLDIKSKEQLMAVFRTPSITSNNLHTLVLRWHSSPLESKDMSILSNCKSLNKLKLTGPIGVSTRIVFPPNLIKLEMRDTLLKEREVMNIINESCCRLRVLVLRDKAYIGSELVCNANSFSQLEKLKLEFLSNIKRWIIEESAMPRLHHLTIKGCENMDLNPEGWTRISMIPQLQRDLSPTFEEKLPTCTTVGMDSSRRRSVSTLFHYDVVRITILAISCILLYQLYSWLALKF